MSDEAPSPFELASAELRKVGIALTRLPGEYCVNFRNGAEATARTVQATAMRQVSNRLRPPGHGLNANGAKTESARRISIGEPTLHTLWIIST